MLGEHTWNGVIASLLIIDWDRRAINSRQIFSSNSDVRINE